MLLEKSEDFKTWLMKQLSMAKSYVAPVDEPVESEPLTMVEPLNQKKNSTVQSTLKKYKIIM